MIGKAVFLAIVASIFVALNPINVYAGFWNKCSVYSSPVTMEKIAYVESGGSPYAIDDDTMDHSYFLKNYAQAYYTARLLINEGHNIDVGLVQINSSNIYMYHLKLRNVLDPCYNVYIGSYILYLDYNKALTMASNKYAALYMALQAYNSGQFYGDNSYADKVWGALN